MTAYGFRGSIRFHVPGNKGGAGADPGLRSAVGERALLLDIPQDIEGIDVGPSPTLYERAELLAAEAYGAQQCWFLTNGATQGNHALSLALAPPGTRVMIQRNSHASLIDGLVLSGGLPSFVAPEYDPELGMAHGVEPDALADALERASLGGPIDAVFIVSPTYYGMAADVAGCAEVAHAAGVPLVVDCAWGAHFGFHADLPPSPIQLGADAMLASTHKIVGSMTHVGDADGLRRRARRRRRRRPGDSARPARPARTRCCCPRWTPPAAGWRSTARALLDRTMRAAAKARAAIDAVPGCRVVGEQMVGRPGDRRLGSAADRDRRAGHRADGLPGRFCAARLLRHLSGTRNPRDEGGAGARDCGAA